MDRDARTLVLAIEDDGPGLSEGRFDEVLRRGTRLDERDPGGGLGLSLVDELVRAYGGTLTSVRGEWDGVRVQVRLPGTFASNLTSAMHNDQQVLSLLLGASPRYRPLSAHCGHQQQSQIRLGLLRRQ